MLIFLVCAVILGGGVLIVGGFLLMIYNRLQRLNVLVDEAWSGIDVQLKKRFDLIPNLVETVKAYATHESKVFEDVARLRSGMMQAEDPAKLSALEGEFRATLKSLFAVAENYPELKADAGFRQLQDSLQEIENELEGARRYYNGTARDLNTQLVIFPNNVIAGFIPSIKKRAFFEVENEAERQNVKVDFSNEAASAE